jgi:spermidine synthase
MKPTIKIASTQTRENNELRLYEHDGDYSIMVDGHELMSSRQTESELELARLGCDRISERRAPVVLIGGLGMGFTLRQTLDMLQPDATVIVAELLPDVVKWNRDIIGHLADHPLRDKRVTIRTMNVATVMAKSKNGFDAIMLDVDNGPEAMTTSANNKLYTKSGINNCLYALHSKGCLSIWSASKDLSFESRLRRANLFVRAFHVAKRKNGKNRPRCIWVASREKRSLPARED